MLKSIMFIIFLSIFTQSYAQIDPTSNTLNLNGYSSCAGSVDNYQLGTWGGTIQPLTNSTVVGFHKGEEFRKTIPQTLPGQNYSISISSHIVSITPWASNSPGWFYVYLNKNSCSKGKLIATFPVMNNEEAGWVEAKFDYIADDTYDTLHFVADNYGGSYNSYMIVDNVKLITLSPFPKVKITKSYINGVGDSFSFPFTLTGTSITSDAISSVGPVAAGLETIRAVAGEEVRITETELIGFPLSNTLMSCTDANASDPLNVIASSVGTGTVTIPGASIVDGGDVTCAVVNRLNDPAEITVTKVADRSITSTGEIITYTITLRNTGETDGRINVQETVPIGTTHVAGDSFGTDCPSSAGGGTICIERSPNVVVNGTATMSFTVLVDDAVLVDEIINVVIEQGDISPLCPSEDPRCVVTPIESGIQGRLWFDADGDGIQGVSENGIADVSLLLTGTDNDGNAITPQTVETDSDGNYKFDALFSGTYIVSIIDGGLPRADLIQTFGVDGLTKEASVVLLTGQNIIDRNFGFTLLTTIGDTVWWDIGKTSCLVCRADGIQQLDGSEPGISGVVLQVFRVDDAGNTTIFSETMSDNNGEYQFDVPQGKFLVKSILTSASYDINGQSIITGGIQAVYDRDGLNAGSINQTIIDVVLADDSISQTLAVNNEILDIDFGYINDQNVYLGIVSSSAKRLSKTQFEISWSGYEIDNIGYLIFADIDGKPTRVSEFIPSKILSSDEVLEYQVILNILDTVDLLYLIGVDSSGHYSNTQTIEIDN